ncbi:MAG: DJ-1/PfpI family protein [Polyangiales bacterium]
MTSLNRRDFLAGIAAAGALGQLAAARTARAAAGDAAGPVATSPLTIAMLLYPGCTANDLIAPQLTFATLPGATVHVVWKDMEPVVCDSGIAICPSATLADCPRDLDVLFVGGAKQSTWPLMIDDEVVGFLRDRGARAKYVTGVCTGTFLLGAAGLLRGYRATSFWPVRHLLSEVGAELAEGRVVVDRNRITGGGNTAGMDFGLRLSEILRGSEIAERQQLLFEYEPDPPFAGSPERARPEIVAMVRKLCEPGVESCARYAKQAAARF